MNIPDPVRVAARHRLKLAARQKQAGEVRFIKDRGGDKSEWAWNTPTPSNREVPEDFVFNPRYLKPLAHVLRSLLMALGHATSAHSRLVKVKSRDVSPDGSLGGRGYVMKIPDMRRQLMNCVEALSSMSDTVYDELTAPHWRPAETPTLEEVQEIVEDAEEIREDPEGWAEGQEEAESDSKRASLRDDLQTQLTLAVIAAENAMHEINTLPLEGGPFCVTLPLTLNNLTRLAEATHHIQESDRV